jgi:hypothetical protein
MATVTRMDAMNSMSNYNTAKELSTLDKRFPGCTVGFGDIAGYEVIADDDCSTPVKRQGNEFVFTNEFGLVEHLPIH